jgi:hypothetical protein
MPNSIALLPCSKDGTSPLSSDGPEMDRLVKTVTDAVMNAMKAS